MLAFIFAIPNLLSNSLKLKKKKMTVTHLVASVTFPQIRVCSIPLVTLHSGLPVIAFGCYPNNAPRHAVT